MNDTSHEWKQVTIRVKLSGIHKTKNIPDWQGLVVGVAKVIKPEVDWCQS